MPFPEAKRILFNKNPLDIVICQLKFPSILKIDSDLPAEFQEAIRKQFPIYLDDSQSITLDIPEDMKSDVPIEFLSRIAGNVQNHNYAFQTEKGEWKVNLANDFLALSSKTYTRWEDFEEKLRGPMETLCRIYEPAFFQRVGLRYVDVIKRSMLNLSKYSWDELLSEAVTGLLASTDTSKSVSNYESRYILDLEDSTSKVKLIIRIVKDPNDGEECFLIDSDFHTNERIEIDSVLQLLNYYRVKGSQLIQW